MASITPEEDEERRLRQVHQYLSLRDAQNEKRIEVTKIESPDTALTAFTQLVAWRMDAQRAIVSLVDRNDQYFIAESTPTLDLNKTGDSDWLWVGCTGSTSRGIALCAQTIKAPEPLNGYSSFCVPDLRNNPRYDHLPYVMGEPFFRFYCGTPLVTEDGFRIGSLFVIDQRPREEIPSENHINFMGIMAANVMKHLDNQREAERRKRIMIMSKGLAAFTEGKHRIETQWKEQNHAETGTSKAHAKRIDLHRASSTYDGTRKKSPTLASALQVATSTGALENNTSSQGKNECGDHSEMPTHASVLARASNLLRESLDVAFSVFLDTSKGGSRVVSSLQVHSRSPNRGTKLHQSVVKSLGGKIKSHPASVLSFSTTQSSSSSQDDASLAHFNLMDTRMVNRLLKRHPDGHLWSFDRDGHEMGVEKEEKTHYVSSDSETQIKIAKSVSKEGSMLMSCFRGARQVLYAPLFDIATSRSICACFAVSLKEVPAFATDVELTWLRAFLNNVAVEWDRVSVSIADRQKGDFLSSISHEFRSPLHGILASTELLSDSKLEDSERSLCETIQGCGETLLHTVSHILDYAKVNDFNHRLVEAGDLSPTRDRTSEDQLTSIALYSDVDVAAICESAIQSVCVGSAFGRRMSHIVVPHETELISSPSLYSLPEILKAPPMQQDAVAIILYICPGFWTFHCAPGAIQRILMNLVGNSLKYTKSGHIIVKIEGQTEMQHQPGGEKRFSQVTITVSDTGIGMSKDFLRYKLFTPFSQESAVAPGTGLGMSMVKKIVQSLEGDVHVDSEINEGTQVTVHFPLNPFFPDAEDTSHSPPGPSKIPPNPVSSLRLECPNKTVAFFEFESVSTILLKGSIQFYLTEWYHFSIIRDLHRADFVVVDETALNNIFDKFAKNLPQRIVASMSTTIRDNNMPSTIQSILKPIGPYGLAKALLNCWNRNPPTVPQMEVPVSIFSAENPSVLPSDLDQKDLATMSIQGSQELAPVSVEPEPVPILATQDIAVNITTTKPTLVSRLEAPPEVQIIPSLVPKTCEIREPRRFKVAPEVMVSVFEVEQPRILCVDDNPINLKVLRAYLKKLDKRNVSFAENGLEALKAVESSGTLFDLIFMDLSMPICDGFESTERIRKLEKQRRKVRHPVGGRTSFIIALTGQASSRDQDQAFASGVDRFVTKPLSLSHLKTLLNELETKGKLNVSQADSDESHCCEVDLMEGATATVAG